MTRLTNTTTSSGNNNKKMATTTTNNKKSQSMKDTFGNSFAFDRVATEPRFNAMKATATPSVGYYSPVYTLTLPTLTGGILPKSGITEKYVPKSIVKERNSNASPSLAQNEEDYQNFGDDEANSDFDAEETNTNIMEKFR